MTSRAELHHMSDVLGEEVWVADAEVAQDCGGGVGIRHVGRALEKQGVVVLRALLVVLLCQVMESGGVLGW